MPDQTAGAAPETPDPTAAQAAETGTEQGSEQQDSTEPGQAAGGKYSQADLDRAISKAIATREQGLKVEAERKAAEQAGEFKRLYESEKARVEALELRDKTRAALREAGIPELETVFESDLGSIEGRVAAAAMVRKIIAGGVKAELAERLKMRPPENGTGAAAASGPKPISEMTSEEYQAYKGQKGLA